MASEGEVKKHATYIKDLPENTNEWNCVNAHNVYKLFKVRTCVVNVDTILWPAGAWNLQTVFGLKAAGAGVSASRENVYHEHLDYLDEVLRGLNILDEKQWYLDNPPLDVDPILDLIINAMDTSSDKWAAVNEKIKTWLVFLGSALELDPDHILEVTYEEVFRYFLLIVGLCCSKGNFSSSLSFHYQNSYGEIAKKVNSEPDLLVYNVESTRTRCPLAVVEVKRDEQLLQAVRRGEVAVGGNGEDNTVEEHGFDCSLLKEDYHNGKPRLLTRDEEATCMTFLPQLLGEAMAAMNSPNKMLQTVPLDSIPPDHMATKSVIGFGVVGFKVYVVNMLFINRNGHQLENPHEIPMNRGMCTDVLVTEPLSMLKRQDRDKLFRLMFAMKKLIA